MFDDLFNELIPDLHEHFRNENVPDLMWISKWFMSIFLYSFPLGLCIRFWDNILAFGTRFMFNISLSILQLLRTTLLDKEFAEIVEYFQMMKDDSHLDEKYLPPYELIIEGAINICISD